MCYKVSQSQPLVAYKEYYKAIDILRDEVVEGYAPYYNANGFAHPNLLVITGHDKQRALDVMQWGLLPPTTWKFTKEKALLHSNNTLNAKSETINEIKSFKENIKKYRCILPVEGFFEYKHVGKDKLPFFIYPKKHPVFNLACVYGNYQDPITQEWTKSFSIVTGAANVLMADIHNTKFRQPLIIGNEQIDKWLNPETDDLDLQLLMTPCDDANMGAYRVHRDLQRIGNTAEALQEWNEETLF